MTTPESPGAPGGSPTPGGTPRPLPKFDPNAAHQQKPRLRPVRAFAAQVGNGQPALGLSDSRQISEKVVLMPPSVQVILPLMNGERSLEEIVSSVGRGLTRPILEMIVAQLDDAGLLFGPVFEGMRAKMREEFDQASVLPPGSSAQFADALVAQELGEGATDEQKAEQGPKKLASAFDAWIAKALESASDPSLDALPRAIVAPHLDYWRGWLNYASAWGRLRVTDRPDRVVILGTNHFGEGTGVVGCDKGYRTPLGVCELDGPFLDALRGALGAESSDRLMANRYDHEREHSIELQIPWVQHILGKDASGQFCRVFGALVHDPTVNGGESYDGTGLGMEPFVRALRQSIASSPGKTLIVASADLSHVGRMFGDDRGLAGESREASEARDRVFTHDREMIELIRQRKADDFVAAMAWQQNPTRWCSIGNLVAMLKTTADEGEPAPALVYNYAAAMDPEGNGMVSSVSMVVP